MENDRLITIAIYTYEKAQIIKNILENEGIPVMIQNVNLIQPVISSGVRVRINEKNLPHALHVLEQYPFLKDDAQVEPETERPKRILIPIDFSDYSIKACQVGFNFAKTLDAEVMLFHAYFSPYFPGAIPVTDTFNYEINNDEALQQVQGRVEKELKKFTTSLHHQIKSGLLPDIRFNSMLREGIPEDEINVFSKEYEPTLIVMGTRGKNQKELDLIGSVTAEVLDSSRYPVYVVPENLAFTNLEEIRNIAFFINFDQQELIALDMFMRLMGKYKFAINFVHIANKQDNWNEIKLAGIKDYFGKHYPGRDSTYTMVDGSNFLDEMEDFIRSRSIDVMALSTRKRNIFARLFNPSIAHKMLFHADTPLLVIPSV